MPPAPIRLQLQTSKTETQAAEDMTNPRKRKRNPLTILAKNAIVSWKTTAAGIVGAIAIVAPHIQTLLDNDPATNPDWNIVVAAISAIFAAMLMRDAEKRTEDHTK